MNTTYRIAIDVTTELSPAFLDAHDMVSVPMPMMIDGKPYIQYPDSREIGSHEFFDLLRAGARAQTSQINMTTYMEVFEPVLKEGRDILYLCFSSGLSSTIQSARLAIDALLEQYPERSIRLVDTLCATSGGAVLVDLALEQQAADMPLDALGDYLDEKRHHVCHWFMVDDLQNLYRGGRLSRTSALAGSLLNIKPILHVSEDGKLELKDKARGKHKALQMIAKRFHDTVTEPEKQIVYISHGDDAETAEKLAEILRAENNIREVRLFPLGPIIGAHAGPGTIALIFQGTER